MPTTESLNTCDFYLLEDEMQYILLFKKEAKNKKPKKASIPVILTGTNIVKLTFFSTFVLNKLY